MNKFKITAYTPATIGFIKFRIPLYQRPYSWKPLQIQQLLTDLYSQFKKDRSQKYFIGILNVGSTENSELFDLIDGKQRITTLNLIGKVLSEKNYIWNDFLNHRLDLYGRKEDQLFLEKMDVTLSPNPKMVEAVNTIKSFIKEKEDLFAQYVYENAAFFISEVPDHYTLIEKNLQFVRMNNRGKQLESHDILKIKLASVITDKVKRNEFINNWNKISQLGCGGVSLEISEDRSLKDLLEIKDFINNSAKETEIFYQSIVNFPEFLLIGLARFFKKEHPEFVVSHQKDKRDTEYRKDRLMEEFGFGEKKMDGFLWTEENALSFINLLQTQFIYFDKCIIKRDKEEKYKFSGDKERFTGLSLIELQVFQSFLYVTREPYQNNWLIETIDYLESMKTIDKINTLEFLNFLKKLDNEKSLSRNYSTFNYPNIDRYWFWRLDYYLWEKRDIYFKNKALEIANKYVFRVNRSIEHVSPQTPKSNSNTSIDKIWIDSFGNLAMISSGQNSSLQNEAFEMKWSHVKSLMNGSINGSIESLKMLMIYEFENWNDENLITHNDIVIKVLINSFSENCVLIRENLKKQLVNNEN